MLSVDSQGHSEELRPARRSTIRRNSMALGVSLGDIAVELLSQTEAQVSRCSSPHDGSDRDIFDEYAAHASR